MEKRKVVTLLACGVFVGFVNGFFGGGGGMIVVPILVYVMRLPVKSAHATALLIILPMTIASCLAYMCNMQTDILQALYVAIGSVAGGVLGALLLKKSKNIFLQILFVCVMLAAGGYMLIR